MTRIIIETYTKTDYKGGKRVVTIYAERTAIGTLYTYHSDYEPARDRYENTDAGENAWFRDCIIKDKEFDSFAELSSKNGWVSKDAKVRTGKITEADVEAMLDAAKKQGEPVIVRTYDCNTIKNWLRVHGMQQQELAAMMDVTPAAISRWLSGKRFPNGKQLIQLMLITNTNPDEYVVEEEYLPDDK